MKLCPPCAIFTPDAELACPKCGASLVAVPAVPTMTITMPPAPAPGPTAHPNPSVPRYLWKFATISAATLIGVFVIALMWVGDPDGVPGMTTATAKGACKQFVNQKLSSPGTFKPDQQITHGKGLVWRIEGGVDDFDPRSGMVDHLTYSCLLEYLGDDKWTSLRVTTQARIP